MAEINIKNRGAGGGVRGAMGGRGPLLDVDFIHKLDRLDVLSRKILLGKLQGERRSKRKGQSVEFADYRNYVAGDDLRFVDWNLFARLDRLFLRLFMEEEDLSVSVLFDASASMQYGEPEKWRYTQQIVAALGYIGLSHYNRVSVYRFDARVRDQLVNQRGRQPVARMLDFVERQEPIEGVAGDLESALREFARSRPSRGVVVVVSDFLDKGDLDAALRQLAGDRFDAYAIQVLSPQEVDPEVGQVIGDLRLHDMEDGDMAEVSVGPALLKKYRATVQAYCQHVRDQCVRRGVTYLFTDTSVGFDRLVLTYLRQRGLVG